MAQSGVRRLQLAAQRKLSEAAEMSSKGLDFAAKHTGIKTAVNLAGGLAEDVSATLRGKKAPKRFVAKSGRELAGQLGDLATAGSLALTGVNLGTKAVKAAVEPPRPSGIEREMSRIKALEAKYNGLKYKF